MSSNENDNTITLDVVETIIEKIYPLKFKWPEDLKSKTFQDILDYLEMIDSDIKIRMFYYFRLGKHFSWALPSVGGIEKIKTFVGDTPVLEIGAGRGLWARMMQEKGISIKPTSIVDNFYYNGNDMKDAWTDVEIIDARDAVLKYQPTILFLSWGNGILNRALEVFTGEKIIIVGEIEGCTDYIPKDDENYTLVDRYKFRDGSLINFRSDEIFFYQSNKRKCK